MLKVPSQGMDATGTAQDEHILFLATCRPLPKLCNSQQFQHRHMTHRGKAALQLCSHSSSSTLPSSRLAQP